MSTTNESIWNDIRRRGIGADIKQEDNVNNMGIDDFVDYLVANYRDKVYSMDKDHFCKEYEMDIVVDPIKDIVIYGSYVNDELSRIMVVLRNRGQIRLDDWIGKIIENSPDNFRWICMYSDKYELKLKEGDVTNQTYVDLIEFFLNNITLFESVWGDIRRRGNGSEIKQEDDIPPHLKKVLSRYIEMFANRCYYQGDYTAESAPDFRAFVRDFANNPKIEELHPNISELINYFEHMDVWNNVVLPLILKAVEKVDKDEELLVDKLWDEIHSTNESVWGDIRKGGNGVKKAEDIIQLDDKYVDKFELCLKFFVEGIVYYEKYRNDFNDFKEYIINDTKRFGEVWVGNTTAPLSDVLLPYVEDNWDKYDNIKKQINDRVLEEERKISKLGFKKEPGKTIYDTLYDWWDSLDDDKKNDILVDKFWDAAEERFYKYHLDNDEFTGEDLEPDEEWDSAPFPQQIEIYLHYSKMNESVWNDIRKRSNGSEIRKEEEVLTDNEINAINEFISMYCRGERAHYIQNHIVPPPPSRRKENDYEGLIKYIEDRRDENMFTNVGDYNKIIRFIKNNWDNLDMDKYIKKRICTPDIMNGKKLVECEGVPGGLTPADVGGMGAAYFPGPNGEPGSGDLPSPTGVVYHQVAPYTMFLKGQKKKKKKKKFRIEDEPCAHSKNSKTYDYVDDFREYVDRTYNNIDRRK